ncbi:DNA-directed RNA polymerase V subunit 5A-like [Actinidia eriantha]|uniref:DNA-directed RNA polymerase V subunit 5A-like n=1 Tax=Actinidia eriantha TaxID=165200 RepID=UPI00258C4EF5|nr:DNA-directed RNA polymerase V subunit 5A-like [Actinidia eriantha]
MEGEAAQRMDLNGEAYDRCLSSYVDDGSTESHRYYLSRRTVLEMLRDRGYSIPTSEIELSLKDFRGLHGQNPDIDRLRISASLRSDPSNKILVVFCGRGVVKVNVIRIIATQIINKDTLSRLIIIVQNRVTNQALKAVDLFNFKVEIFQITELLVNITKHEFKPKHRVLTDKEKKKLLEKFTLEEKQLPRMLQKDAIARYYGLEKGQVVKFTYSDDITESHISYRCVW